ncbi:hypothetical protein, unknown function [Leishmania infantum JPCM5]|uniref:Cyclic_nucleotide-binding_domain_containing_protein_-_putative n=2 Tax=Leishmania infantum TaxID=5671 RepID=A0A6L0XWC1_LEIIN|nr:hypothetical protein, unknown function [Leishmania infantum JPCM5]CAC9517766.1 Cyclic_nucleotide-binding_domain_containing_protein_-_putative [Leishmania infantum]CAM70374.1 hypothetical protein, unknown function [Leishmania infantum JPCM5]SUZ44254.1 Cyclic_nucleotide-binding_domain_containing_protein_-_putative [Leishmania infantum]|eukprot:XP_001467318.1 hypothetical protein, unknown function [Leishmania infantum JPCM5]
MGACCCKNPTSSVAMVAGEGVESIPQGGEGSGGAPTSSTFSGPSACPLTLPGHSEGETATVASMPLALDSADKIGAEGHFERGDGSDELSSDTWPSLHARVWRRRGGVSGETPSRALTAAMWQWRQPPWESPEEWQVLRRVLCGHPLFAACRDDASMLRDVMEVFERQETQPGEVIASPGDSCAFHVVVKGQAVADVGDGDAVIAQAKNKRQEWAVGDYFGSEGLLYVLNPDDEGAAVCAAGHPDASSPTATWRLNRMLYQMLMRTFYDDAHLQLMKYLFQSPLFQHLSRAQIRHLCEKAEMVTWDTSARLLQRGEVPTSLFLLISGTVALMHVQRGGGGHAGVPRVQSIVLGAGDCVGDAELLLLHRAADEEDVTTASKRLIAMHSLCTYAVQKPVQAIRIPIEDLLAVLSGHDLQHMRERSRSVRELELWQRQAQMPGGLRSLVDECLVLNISNPNSDSDSDSDEDSLVLQGGPGVAASPLSRRLSDDASQDVFVKGADATAFFLEQMFSRQTYRRADGRERGLSMATFAPRQRYLVGTVLFHVEYAASGNGMMRASGGLPPSDDGKGAASTAGSSAAAGSRKSHGCLYAVFSGEVTVVNSDTGEAIYSVSRGNTLGEEALLAPLRCCSATNPLRTHAVVSSSDGCEVFELSRRAFKEFLQRPYCEALRDFCSVFCVFPFAWCFPQHYWHFLFNCTTEREAVGGDLIGVRGADCKCVSLILDGRLDAYARSSAADSGGKEQDHDEETSVASFAAGDIVGGWEVMEGRPCNVAYVCVCRTRMLCVPAESFAGLFRPAMPYLRLMWSERRYKRVMVVSATEG